MSGTLLPSMPAPDEVGRSGRSGGTAPAAASTGPRPSGRRSPAPRRSGRPRRRRGWLRWTFLTVLAVYFVVPQLAMARFAFQNVPVIRLNLSTLGDGWSVQPLLDALSEPELWTAARTSVLLAAAAVVLNLALLLPLAILAEIRAPRLRPWLTGLTLLPWVVPPIALVVGVSATFRSVAPWFLASDLSLVPFYAVWAMPFTYRALDAGLRGINARTLVEAGRSLGASAPTVLGRVLVPNLGPSIVASGGLTAALVLGEFAFASLLLKNTLPTYLVIYQRQSPQGGMALALVILLLTAVGLAGIVRLLRRRGLDVSTAGL
ncbi:ABC transporter permease subunit [Cellulomonas hominis]